MRPRPTPTRRAFSLLEAMLVVIVLGVLAGVVMPGLGAIDEHRGAAAFEEIQRSLRHARASAIASGTSCGVRFRTAGDDRIDLVRMHPDAPAIVPLLTPLGVTSSTIYIASEYPSVAITDVENGDGSNTDDETIWFLYDGTPHTRDSSGSFVAENTAACRIEVTWGSSVEAVIVHPGTGYIEEE